MSENNISASKAKKIVNEEKKVIKKNIKSSLVAPIQEESLYVKNHKEFMKYIGPKNLSDILDRMVYQATRGDVGAAKLLIDRYLPKRIGQPIDYRIGLIPQNAKEISQYWDALFSKIDKGELSYEECAPVFDILTRRADLYKLTDIDLRLENLESQLTHKS